MLPQVTALLFFAAIAAPRTTKGAERNAQGDLGKAAGILDQDAAFDYVIIGGGTAGLLMANRLSANPNITVAVIEAGAFYQITNPLLSETPAGDVVFVGADPKDSNPLVDWDFVTEQQAGANNRKIHYARGKCLGGSSARNFMIYQRGTEQSYNKWANAVGDDSYKWDALQPHFKRSVTFTPPSTSRFANASAEFNTSGFSTPGGPLQVSYPNYAQPFSTWMEPALNEIGVPSIQDFNSGKLLGAQYCSSTIRPGSQTRDSSQTSFLNEALGRQNLKVYITTRAKKILFDSNKRATGVIVESYAINLLKYTLLARKEVILSAGAFQSPQLLMVSGIGPQAELQKHNIPIIADRPGVGQTMEDHVFFGPTWRVNLQTVTRVANDLLWTAKQYAIDYTISKRGPLTSPASDFLGWEKLPRNLLTPETDRILNETFPPDWPEMEYLVAPGYVGNLSNPFADQPKDGYQYATIMGALVAPLSRGNVTLKSADTKDLPLINPNWLTHKADIDVAVAIYKRLQAAFASNTMREILLGGEEYFPGPSVQTNKEILEVIRNTVMTVWHAACTCRMGKREDPMAVVDKDAKVIGVEGLRVVDASSFALLPPGHPQSAVYMLAEKVSEGILEGLRG